MSSLQAVILAGGKGTRLSTVISDLPKPMAPIGSRPFLALLLDHLVSQGVAGAVLSVGHLHQEICNAFGTQYRSLGLDYVIEENPLGTGGAIAKCLKMVSSDPVLVLNGDTFVALDYRALLTTHREAGALATLTLRSVPDVSRYGCVIAQCGRVVQYEEKVSQGAGLINAGVYVLSRCIFDGYNMPEAFSFERDFLMPRVNELRAAAYITDAYFIDIGTPEGYLQAQRDLTGRRM